MRHTLIDCRCIHCERARFETHTAIIAIAAIVAVAFAALLVWWPT